MIRASLITITLAATTLMSVPTHAYADNPAVEEALRARPDLSTFYQALVNTGVNHELQPNMAYTIFAPTNAAFAQIRQDQYPCFYSAQCRGQVADIVRNHIIPGNTYINTANAKGGYYSIGHRFVTLGEPFRNDFAVGGHNIIYTSAIPNGTLYKIDGVIASPTELASLQNMEYASAETTRVIRRVITDPACGPYGCPDAAETVVTRTYTVPE